MMSMMQGQEAVKGSSKCKECGNQAKKDCSYSRCRTCCKNKGFRCQTHIRSTWIPVDRRRHKVEQQPPPTTNLLGDIIPKSHNKHNAFSSLEEFKFPAVMSSTVLFSCVQVRSMDEKVNEIAYQTSVNIGGHVFSGLLYDQGPEQSFNDKGNNMSIDPFDQQRDLHLWSASVHTRDGASSSMPPLSATTTTQELLFPPPQPFPLASFRPDMTYLSHQKP